MKHRPVLRRCIACRELLDRQKLLKVTRDFKDGRLTLGNGMGRSAYLCRNEGCLEEAWRRKRFQRSLRCKVPVSLLEMLQNRLRQ